MPTRRVSAGSAAALLPLLLALGCERDALVGAIPVAGTDGAADLDRMRDSGFHPFDLRPPPDFATCAPGALAFGTQIDTYVAEFLPNTVATTDLDHDGLLDLAVTGARTVGLFGYEVRLAVLRGAGDGTF